MAYEYKHTQPGYITAAATGAGSLLSATRVLRGGLGLAMLPVALLLAGVAVVFSSLTVEIRDGRLRAYFGPGLVAKNVRVRDIESVQVVENSWFSGWGIRVTPRGMLYNVSGVGAVEVRMSDGNTFRLGTDEPEVLRDAIARAIAADRARGME